MGLWAGLLVRDSNSVLGDDASRDPTNSLVANRSAIVSEKSREASDEEMRLMLKTVTEKVTGARVADSEDVDGLTRRILKFQLDRRKTHDEQVPQFFGPM